MSANFEIDIVTHSASKLSCICNILETPFTHVEIISIKTMKNWSQQKSYSIHVEDVDDTIAKGDIVLIYGKSNEITFGAICLKLGDNSFNTSVWWPAKSIGISDENGIDASSAAMIDILSKKVIAVFGDALHYARMGVEMAEIGVVPSNSFLFEQQNVMRWLLHKRDIAKDPPRFKKEEIDPQFLSFSHYI